MSGVKKISNYDPILKDQGIDYLVGAAKAGQSQQSVTFAMPAGGVVTFAGMGIANMFDGNYQVFFTDNTTAGAAKATAKTGLGFTITGPTTADSLDILIVGRLANQVA